METIYYILRSSYAFRRLVRCDRRTRAEVVAFDGLALAVGGGFRDHFAVTAREPLSLLASVLAPRRHHERLQQHVAILAAAVEPPPRSARAATGCFDALHRGLERWERIRSHRVRHLDEHRPVTGVGF